VGSLDLEQVAQQAGRRIEVNLEGDDLVEEGVLGGPHGRGLVDG
jgi:hypothetical protein